uniref:Uncharacterized protein n=1 Tax=Romanomermis culicivorax TaxID=13658 RepID=A0A915JJJ9_ROMCU
MERKMLPVLDQQKLHKIGGHLILKPIKSTFNVNQYGRFATRKGECRKLKSTKLKSYRKKEESGTDYGACLP